MNIIIEKYDKESKRKIRSDEFVIEYKKNIEESEENLKNLKYNSSFFFKLTHPITLIKTGKNLKKLNIIKEKFDELIERPITEFIDEETGNIETDLENAMIYKKPYCIRHYMGLNPIEEIGYSKKLKK